MHRLLVAPLITVLFLLGTLSFALAKQEDVTKAEIKLEQMFDKMPLVFEANKGQFSEDTHFLSRGPGYSLFLAPTESKILLIQPPKMSEPGSTDPTAEIKSTEIPAPETALISMKLEGANVDAKSKGLGLTTMKSNYFVGSDSSKWRSKVDNFSKVQFEQVYPGIDLVYYGKQRQLEYDFVVQPGADYQKIQMVFDGAESVMLDRSGNLLLKTKIGDLSFQIPEIYQEENGKRVQVEGKFVLNGKNRVGFEVASYDIEKSLVIDPTLTYSTYIGGNSSDFGSGIAADASGIYVVGITLSSDFIATPGAFDTARNGNPSDYAVFKLNPTTGSYIYSTFLGGSNSEFAPSIAVDASGAVYIVGATGSHNFPVTTGAFDTIPGGGSFDYTVTKLSPDGASLVYSSFLGGSGDEWHGYGSDKVAVDSLGAAYITGTTTSSDFPTTTGAFDETYNGSSDGFVTKVSPDGSSLLYSTYLGGTDIEFRYDIAVDSLGSAYVSGRTTSNDYPTTIGVFDETFNGISDQVITKLSPDGSSLVYSTYFGGTRAEGNSGSDIAVDASGFAYAVGTVDRGGVPTTSGAFNETGNGHADFYIFKLSQDGSSLLYSTYLGGIGIETRPSISIDVNGSAYIHGSSQGSPNYPTTTGAFDTSINHSYDVVVTKLNPAGSSLDYSTFLGGNMNEYAYGNSYLDEGGNLHVVGTTCSTDFPVVNPTQVNIANGGPGICWDMYVSRFSGFDAGVVIGGDTAVPTITAPSDISIEATGPITSTGIGSPIVSDDVSTNANITISNDAPAGFPLGSTTVTWTATDEAGNTSTGTQNVTVVDTTAPVVTAPTAVTLEATAPLTPVTLGAGTASDLVDGVLTPTASPTGPFAVGTHNVTWTATDAKGNVGAASQSITIIDTTKPALTVPGDVSVEATSAATTLAIGTATASDIVDGTMTPTNDAPATFSVGTTVVNYTVTDAVGNTSTGTQNVTVVDTTAPVVTAPTQVMLEATAPLTQVVLGTPTVSDLVSSVSNITWTNDAPTAGYPVDSTTTVTWTATDEASNSVTATQEVTIKPFLLTLNIEKAKVKLHKKGPGKDKIKIKGRYAEFANGDGLNLNEAIVMVNGVSLSKVQFKKKGKFEVEGEHLNLSGIDFSVPVTLSVRIGNDLGEQTVLFDSKGKLDDDDKDKDDDKGKKEKEDKKRKGKK